jgi:hypothetical protein
MVTEHDLGSAIGIEFHVFAVHDETTGVDPFGVIDAAAVGPVSADLITAINRASEAPRHAIARHRHVGTRGKHRARAAVGER